MEKETDRTLRVGGGQAAVPRTGDIYPYLKRTLDVLLAAILLILLSPIIFFLAMLVRADSVGPAFFVQERVGREGKRFLIVKLRTMYLSSPHDLPSSAFSDREKQITRIGFFLRRFSLDELPQLWNILLGEMSFVGPRPVIPAEEGLIAYRHALGTDRVRPGLTGLAQVRGRDALSDREKALFDARYAHTLSFLNDLRIFLLTVPSVILGRGAD